MLSVYMHVGAGTSRTTTFQQTNQLGRIPVGHAGTGWRESGPVTEATGLAITSTLPKLPSTHFRASQFNLPKVANCNYFQNDIHSCMTTVNIL